MYISASLGLNCQPVCTRPAVGYEAEAGSMMSSGDLSLLSSVTADPAAAEEIWFPLVVVFWEDILLLFMFGPVEIILDGMPTPPSTTS